MHVRTSLTALLCVLTMGAGAIAQSSKPGTVPPEGKKYTLQECVTFALVPAERTDLVKKYAVDGKLPIAVLAETDGTEISRVDNRNGELKIGEVEKSLKEAIRTKEDGLGKRLTDAATLANGGEREKAGELPLTLRPSAMSPGLA